MKVTIFDTDNWREIFTTLSRNKTRTFLTAFGIFWGTAILALCWGGGRGFQGMMRRNFQGIATNLGYLATSVTTKPYMGYNKGRQWALTDRDIAQIRRTVKDIDMSSAVVMVSTIARYSTKSVSVSALGVEPDFWHIQQVRVIEGRLPNPSDEKLGRKHALIGKTVAGQLFGDESPLGRMVQLDGIYFKIVGVAEQLQEASIGGNINESVVVPISTIKLAYQLGDNNGYFVFTTPAGISPADIEPRMSAIIKENHMIAPDDTGAIDFGNLSEMFEMIDNVFTGVDLLTLFVGMGTLLAGVIGVGNIMWIIVKERTREIGIRRAIGATPSDIIAQILSESMVLTTIAGLGGITLAVIILGIVDHANYNPWLGSPGFELRFGHAVTILTSFFVLGTGAGAIPAFKAMKIKPVQAMNDK